ncbi:hypothetical protein [Falsiroseomonas ponticola]|uniref:hypothetical protein n=1 Tax=Falsiroseomonas ponticola TaxID=2786951 RepID=UPI0019344F64|nr:hypothetical protein [Roseomonas ponticola]
MSALTVPLLWRQPARRNVALFLLGLFLLPQLSLWATGIVMVAASAVMAGCAAAALWHAERGGMVTRLGLLKRFVLAGLIPGVIGVTFALAAGAWAEAGPGGAALMLYYAPFIIPYVALYAVAAAALAGLAAGFLLFRPAA